MHDKPNHANANYHPLRDTDTLETYIRRMCNQKQISLSKLSALTGLNRGALYKIFEPHSNPRIPDLLKIANCLGVHHYYLFRLKWREIDSIAPAGASQKSAQLEQRDTDICGFIDETIPDGTLVGIGSVFTKSWTVQNIGDTVWEGRYYMNLDAPYQQPSLMAGVYPDGRPVSDYQFLPHESVIAVPTTRPGETFTLTVKYTAPNVAGRYVSYWRMVDERGVFCFPNGLGLSVSVLVRSVGGAYRA